MCETYKLPKLIYCIRERIVDTTNYTVSKKRVYIAASHWIGFDTRYFFYFGGYAQAEAGALQVKGWSKVHKAQRPGAR